MSSAALSDVRRQILTRSRTTPDGCWFWEGAVTGDGLYGRLHIPSLGQLAHRVSYKAFVGEIPDGLEIDHLCQNTLCVNPDHLEPVTHRENILRGNGIGGRRARQTHCKRGHEFTDENTLVRLNGTRECRTCKRQHRKARYEQVGS